MHSLEKEVSATRYEKKMEYNFYLLIWVSGPACAHFD